jgi:hypothetical protein
MKKVLGVIVLTAVIFGLNYIGVPGYIVALAIGFISSFSQLGHSQNGRVREKLALTAALATGAIAYFMLTGQSYGAYFGALIFLVVGVGLTRLYKTNYRLWLRESLPSVLRFVMFERIGGAVSGLGYKLDVVGMALSVRYIEAVALLIAFIILQNKITAYIMLASQGAYGQREYQGHKFRKLKSFGKVVAVIALVVVWLNPTNTLLIGNVKNSVMDSLAGLGGIGASTVETISDTNGTSLLMVKSDSTITDEQSALSLLTSYDKNLGGEFRFTGREELPSGDIVYNFVQTSHDVPLYGGGKKLVVGADDKPLYVVGTTKIGADNLSVPSGTISEAHAQNLVNSYFDDNDEISIGSAVETWNSGTDSAAYSLAYIVPITTAYGDDLTVRNNIVLDAVSGEIVDITGFNDGQHGELAEIFAQAKSKGKFSAAEFDTIVQSTDVILSGTNANAWLYRDAMMSECEKYYANQGNAGLGKKNAAAISKAFATAGVDGNNIDEGVVSVDMKSSRVAVKGVVNYPNDIDEIIISHTDRTTQQYTITSDVPVMLTVARENGEIVLSLPVFHEETFEIYPTGQDERYIVSVQAGSTYQKDTKAVSAPIIPNTFAMIQPMAMTTAWSNLFSSVEMANYKLAVKQLNTDLRVENGDAVFAMLQKIENAYNTNNATRFLTLYRFDELSDMFHDQYYNDFASIYGQLYADFVDNSVSSNALSIYAQMALVYYRTSNAMFKATANAYSELSDLNKAVSDSPDKTAMIFFLFGFQGSPENWGDNFTSVWLHLDGTTLDLRYIGSEVKGDKTFISAEAEIKRGEAIVLSKTITLVLQHFGNQQTISDASGNWVSDFIGGIGQYLTAGDYLGLDFSGEQVMISDLEESWALGNTDGIDDTEKYEVFVELPDNNQYHQKIAEKAALYAMLAYDESRYIADVKQAFLEREQGYGPLPVDSELSSSSRFQSIIKNYVADYPRLFGEQSADSDYSYFTGERTKVSFDDVVPYMLLKQLTLDGYSFVESGGYDDTDGSNISYTIASKKVATDEYLIVVVLRGTDTFEWYGNMDVGESSRHSSFDNANKLMHTWIHNYINKYVSKGAKVDFFVMGHSRGAAVANLLAADISKNKPVLGADIGKVYAYTFATPNNNIKPDGPIEWFANIFNFCFTDDFVPQVPLDSWGYSKYGTTFLACADDLYHRTYMTGVGSKTFTSEINTYIKLSEGREPKFDKDSTANVLLIFASVAPTVNDYYHKEYIFVGDYTGEIPVTTFNFMHGTIAPAAILGSRSTQAADLLFKSGIPKELYGIRSFFLDGRKSINDTHQMFTYYAAIRHHEFNLGEYEDNKGSW